jgi:hypothetical protein
LETIIVIGLVTAVAPSALAIIFAGSRAAGRVPPSSRPRPDDHTTVAELAAEAMVAG